MTKITSPADLAALRAGGQILARTLQLLAEKALPGTKASFLDTLAEETLRAAGGEPAFKGYQGFPATVCISINSEVVHGIPGEKVLREGDVVGLDCGVRYKGFVTDATVTVGVGKISKAARQLIDATEQSLWEAVKIIKAGIHTGDIGHAVQVYVEERGYGVVRALVGHGVGKQVHEDPKVPNYGEPGTGTVLPAGVVIALEPMVTAGHWDVRTAADGWSVVTVDGSIAAHYEHTLVVTEEGCEIVTQL
ncbi:MAG: type I methionyl aminopeptidase [bacterium]|nr:type I methionyl aminopeptidase [bacterium]